MKRTVSCFSVSARHPLNVKPSGNALLVTDATVASARENGLGDLAKWSDDLVMTMLGYLDREEMVAMSHTSKVFYAFCYDEELWKKLVLLKTLEPKWKGRWRLTGMGLDPPYSADVQLEENHLCSDILYRPFQCSQIDYHKLFAKVIAEEEKYHQDAIAGKFDELPEGRILRVNEDDADFVNLHDEPFILVNSDASRWPRWDAQELLRRFGGVQFRQEAVQWSLSTYCNYMANNADESPLYLFDCQSQAMKTLRQEYQPPKIFADDLFTVFNTEAGNCRPDHAWIIVGPQRSGSTFHKDPNSTSAWNAALTGRKLWVMLPPDVIPPGVGTDGDESEVTSPVGIAEWVLSGFYNDAISIPQCQVGITFPGECMYVPSGWWHSVINLDDSVALTQNFVPTVKLGTVLNFIKNKPDQLSGFRTNNVSKVVNYILNDSDNETLQKFISEVNDSTIDGDEDCAELGCDFQLPIYEVFTTLMAMQGRAEEVEAATKVVKKAEKPSKWQELTADTGFSFGF